MPVISENQLQCVANKISDQLKEGFKKSEKENHENQLSVTVKQVLSANIEYEESPNITNSQLNSLQTKYIVLKPNQPPLQQATNGKLNNFILATTQLPCTHHYSHFHSAAFFVL